MDLKIPRAISVSSKGVQCCSKYIFIRDTLFFSFPFQEMHELPHTVVLRSKNKEEEKCPAFRKRGTCASTREHCVAAPCGRASACRATARHLGGRPVGSTSTVTGKNVLGVRCKKVSSRGNPPPVHSSKMMSKPWTQSFLFQKNKQITYYA